MSRVHQQQAVRSGAWRGGFSLVEMLIALAITAALLTASLSALDASFKSYKVTTESASTHVVSRIVMHRVMTMIRTGTEFGPYPDDVLDPGQNPIVSSFIEFVSLDDPENDHRQVTTIERRAGDEPGSFDLWYVLEDTLGNTTTTDERPLIRGLREATFTLEYDIGPRLTQATVDLTIEPNDLQDADIFSSLETPTIRLVASTSPRVLDE